MSTRNVVLTDHHQKVIDRLVKSGRYQNASEVLREGIRLVEQREAEDAAKLKSLRQAVNLGLKDIDEGRYVELSESEIAPYVADIGRRASTRVKSRK